MSPAVWSGLEDVLRLLRAAVAKLPKPHRRVIFGYLDTILDRLLTIRSVPASWRTALIEIEAGDWRQVQTLVLQALDQATQTDAHEIHVWLERADHHLVNMRRDLEALEPRPASDEEILRLACHGMLHLFGYDHTNDEDTRQMQDREEHFLGAL